ncbi:MAG: hypothetical protein AAB472_03305 [Patescibacteria group bacterium]
MKRALSSFLLFGLLFLQAPSSRAQDVGSAEPTQLPQGLSRCSDYYHYGSTPVDLTSGLSQVAQNATIAFTGTVTNQNKHPVVDATVWVKILHKRSLSKNISGPDVVDSFPVLEHVTLKAGEVMPVDFSWKVPPDTEPGTYEAATFVSASDRFSYAGIAYTDDVTGHTVDFSIVGENQGAVRFDKDSLWVAGQPFSRAEFPVEVLEEFTSVPLTATIFNTSAVPVKSEVTWSVYRQDPLSKEHLLSTEKQQFKVHPHASTTLSYTVRDMDSAVYYVEGEITSPKGTKSIIGLRYVRAGINEPHLRFVTLDGATAVACIESTGSAPSKDVEVRLSVTPNVWYAWFLEFLHLSRSAHATYKGEIPGNTYAITAPLKNLTADYLVHAEVYQKGTLVDAVRIPYSCTELGTKCDSKLVRTVMIILPFLFLTLLVAGIYLGRKIYLKRQIAKLPWNAQDPSL